MKKAFKRTIKLIRKNSSKDLNKDAYYQYQLSGSVSLVKVFTAIIGLFNLFLLIPDLINITDPSMRLLLIIYRSAFTALAILLFIFIKKISTFKRLAYIITIYELIAVFIFFHVYSMYSSPDFGIQLLGVFVFILVIFLVPNILRNVIVLSLMTVAGFLVCSYLFLDIDITKFAVTVVYTGIEIALCSVFAINFNRYKRGEFIARTELQRIYTTDHLTQIGNRVRLEDESEKWLVYCNTYGLQLSLVLIDVDNLKKVNDQYGHLVGDLVLFEIAQIMHKKLRKNDVCVRWGGDEFVLLLPNTNAEEAKKLAQRINNAITKHEFNPDIRMTCSFGTAEMEDGLSLQQLIRKADASMYNAKKTSKFNTDVSGEAENL